MSLPMDTKDDTLKCGICNKPLSVPPIIHSDTIGNICGRCEDQLINLAKYRDSALERQKVYENIAKYLVFPCAYKVLGCNMELKWGSVTDHESACEYKNVVCPLSHESFQNQCNWVDNHNQLVSHIRKDHKRYFANPPQVVLTNNFGSRILFWEISGRLVVIMLDYKKSANKYLCCVAGDFIQKECLAYMYQVELTSNVWKNNPIIFRKTEVEPLYGNSFARPDNSLEIDIDKIQQLLENSPELIIQFSIVRKPDTETQRASCSYATDVCLNRTENPEIHENLLHDMECPVCVEYMMPPIFFCNAGHNVCGTCYTKVTSCPICRGAMSGGRNLTLEKLTETLNYPCVNRFRGCPFVGRIVGLKLHESNCLLSERECFISNCPWKGPNLCVYTHITDNHPLNKLNTIITHQLQNKVDQYLFSYDDKIFIFKMRFGVNMPLEYVVESFGTEDVQYRHELQIIGSSLIDIKVTLCHICQPLPYNTTKKNTGDFEGISIPFTFLSQFLTHYQQLDFKINILKVKD